MIANKKATKLYKKAFGDFSGKLHVGYAPGRVEILGNHTDYNEGLVLTAAIEQKTICCGIDRPDNIGIIHASDLGQTVEIDINAPVPQEKGHWANYFIGVLKVIQDSTKCKIKGFQIIVSSEIPMSAGCSSSASLETSFATLLNERNKLGLSKATIAQLSQKAENQYAGVMCGLMDQWSVVHGQENDLIYFDNRSLETSLMPLGKIPVEILILNTCIKHTLVDSQYNDRREECQAAVKGCQEKGYKIKSLRDLSVEDLTEIEKFLEPVPCARAKHVVGENHRIEKLLKMERGEQQKALKQFMYASHESSRTLFENSCPELDFLVASAYEEESCLGAKLSGGGFGGCVVALAEPQGIADFQKKLEKKYRERFPKQKPLEVIRTSAGTGAGYFTID